VQVTQKHVNRLLFATQGVGAVFVAVFLAAYMAGLPGTNVLHSEPAFRIPLIIFGAALLVMILATVILAAFLRNKPVPV
jgi:Zn-dependent protease with chaperone function